MKQYKFIDKLKALPFIEEIWLFGSRARGNNQERSDIDIAIICPTATESNWLEVMQVVENSDTLLHVDCIRFDTSLVSDDLYKNILRDKQVIYMKEVYWKNNFYALGKAIDRLKEVVEHSELDKNDYMRDAAIQRFEFTIELFWKVLKKILQYEQVEATTPRDTLSKAYQYKFIDSEDIWLSMLNDRNNTSHAYHEENAKQIFQHIQSYVPIFVVTYEAIKNKYNLYIKK